MFEPNDSCPCIKPRARIARSLLDEEANCLLRSGEPATGQLKDTGRIGEFLIHLSRLRDGRQHSTGLLTLCLFDPDRFHELNERYTPLFADQVLAGLEKRIVENVGSGARTARFRGDQFISVIPDVTEEECKLRIENLRRHSLKANGRTIDLTVSIGLAESSRGCPETPHQLIQRAMVALTHGKQQGGNAVVSWSQLVGEPLVGGVGTAAPFGQAAHWMARLRQHVRFAHSESTRALVAAIDARDPYTRAHSQTVANYAEQIGRAMHIHGSRLEALKAAGLLHDVGKIGVPDAILTKPGPLTSHEFEAVKRHPQTALEILSNVSFLSDVQPLILHHHERFDGSGYPAGLRGDEIPIGARIIAVADALDTMLSPRTYKSAYPLDRVRCELLAGAGTQFDPEVVRVTTELLDESPEAFKPATG